MTHDPLCPVVTITKVIDCVIVLPGTDISTTNLGKTIEYEEGECLCDLIAKVREDERRERVMLEEVVDYYKAYFHRAEQKGWYTGVRDCIAAVESCSRDKGYAYMHNKTGIDWALTALRALQEKP